MWLELFLSNFNKMLFSRFSWWLDHKNLTKVVDKYNRKIHRKNKDAVFINGGDISNFSNFWKKAELENILVERLLT